MEDNGLTLSDMLTAATQVAILLAALAAGYAGLRRWVQRAASDSQQTRQQLATTNGHTAGQLIEATAGKVDELEVVAAANRSRLDMHEARIDAHDVRLDRHIVAGHKQGAS